MADYFIGIGGTGAKTIEALLHLCDCGFFHSDKLKLLLVDADDKNGNKTSTESLLTLYRKCRAYYYRSNSRLFNTDILPVFNAGGSLNDDNNQLFSVSPVSKETGRFTIQENIVKNGPENRNAVNLMKALYSVEDYTRDIKGGFYAHPSIGSLMFKRWLEDDTAQIDSMLQSIRNDASNGEVNIFIVASSFGGTGASGFPALAQKIREDAILANVQSNIHIAGCFILPYFNVENVTSDKTIDLTTFNENAKEALRYYSEHGAARFFDKIYLLANPDGLVRGTYADVGAKQKNWPHIVEVLAVLAADDYFADSNKSRYNPTAEPEWVGIQSQSASTETLQWSDFPRGNDLRQDLGSFLLFNLLYIPCVCGQFIDVKSADRERVHFSVRPSSDVSWRTIKSPAFGSTTGLLKKNYQWKPDIDNHLSFFTDLYQYFNLHIEWLYRLITVYNQKDRCLLHLFGNSSDGKSVMEWRYQLSQLVETSRVTAMYTQLNQFAAHANAYSLTLSDQKNSAIVPLYADIFKLPVQGNITPEETARNIMQRVYDLIKNACMGGNDQ